MFRLRRWLLGHKWSITHFGRCGLLASSDKPISNPRTADVQCESET